MVLVRRGDDAECVAGGTLAESSVVRGGKRFLEQPLDAVDPRARQRERAGTARTADRASRLRRVPHERRIGDVVGRQASRPALDPLALSFQLKLLWLSGYLPHLTSCADCGAETELVGYSAKEGGAVCRNCNVGALALSPAGITGIEGLLARPLAEARGVGLAERSTRDALAVITSAYEYFGNFRLRALRSA